MKLRERSRSRHRNRIDQNLASQQENTIAQRRETDAPINQAIEQLSTSAHRRPNTSAGIRGRPDTSPSETGASVAKHLRKPTCLEDLQNGGRTLDYTDGLDTFHFPTPELGLPSPSPRMLLQYAAFQQRSVFGGESPGIGIAIGSPSHAPPSWGACIASSNVQRLDLKLSSRTPSPRSPVPPLPMRAPPSPPRRSHTVDCMPEQRKINIGWIGNLFRKSDKHVSRESTNSPSDSASGPRSPYFRRGASLEAVMTSPHYSTQVSTTNQSKRLLAGVVLQDKMTAEPQAPETSSMAPLCFKSFTATSIPSPRTIPTLDSNDRPKAPNKLRHDSPMEHRHIDKPPLAIPEIPRLELNFPKPEFDRYSIMFERLLVNESKPSLFERRQSRFLKRKSGKQSEDTGDTTELVLNSGIANVPLRSISSPHPGGLQSTNSGFELGRATEQSSFSVRRPLGLQRSQTTPAGTLSPNVAAFPRNGNSIPESSPVSMASVFFSESSLPPTPTTGSMCSNTDSVQRMLEMKEPAWEMITSQPVEIASPMELSPSLLGPYSRVSSPENIERQIVQVSVARQVSMNRAKSLMHHAGSIRQPLRPRVVELSKNRKSTVGVLESDLDDVEPLPSRAKSHTGMEAHNGATRPPSLANNVCKE